MTEIHERLLDLLGKPVKDPSFELVLKELGKPDYEDEYMPAGFEFYEQGLFIATDSARFSALNFYFSTPSSEFGWNGSLPEGINANDGIEAVERKLSDKRLIYRHLCPDCYRIDYAVSPYELTVRFLTDTEKMSMLAVKYMGIFTDTSILENSYLLRLPNGEKMQLFKQGIEIPDFESVEVSTKDDGQHAIEIAVFQGELENGKDNSCYARYLVHQISATPAGAARVEIRFEILIDGNLKVTATDKHTQRDLSVTVFS